MRTSTTSSARSSSDRNDFEMNACGSTWILDAVLPEQRRMKRNRPGLLNLATTPPTAMPEGGDLYVSPVIAKIRSNPHDVHDTGLRHQESDRKPRLRAFLTTKEVGRGTGLGLSICYKIVETIWARSNFDTVTGEGTTFRVICRQRGGSCWLIPLRSSLLKTTPSMAPCARACSNAAAIVQKPPRPPGSALTACPESRHRSRSGRSSDAGDGRHPASQRSSKASYPHIEFIVMTRYGTVKTAVEAMPVRSRALHSKAARPR